MLTAVKSWVELHATGNSHVGGVVGATGGGAATTGGGAATTGGVTTSPKGEARTGAHPPPAGVDEKKDDVFPLIRLLPDAYLGKQLNAVVQQWLLLTIPLLPPEGVAMV